MRNILVFIGGCSLLAVVCFMIASREHREAIINEVAKLSDSSDGEKAPQIVREQQRKERLRQDKEWTSENQALYPIEYCQAQLEKLLEYARKLDVQAHKYAVAKNKALREVNDAEAHLVQIAKFLDEAKRAYKDALAKEKWPVMIRGFALSKEKAQEKIVAAAEKRPVYQSVILKNKALIVQLEKKSERVAEEQKNIVKTKERIQIVINDLNLKKVIDVDAGVKDTLNAINDSLGSLGTNYEDPGLEDLLTPEKASEIKVSFDAIMAE